MLGIRVDSLDPESGDIQPSGWNEAEREVLRASIAARQPFLDFIFTHTAANGAQKSFRVSGEPMFDRNCRYIGYRGVGVELASKKCGI